MKRQNTYKGKLDCQSEFSHRYATWARNHNGWAKMKRANKRIAKKRVRREINKTESENDVSDTC